MKPGSKPKGAGLACIPSTYCDFDAREHAAQRERGKFIALTADIDKGNHPLATVRAAIEQVTDGAAWLIYSSPHSRPDDQRWRIILPLETEQPFEAWHDAQLALYAFLEARGIACDHALARAAQPVYLPNVPAVHAKSETPLRDEKGEPLYFEREGSDLTAPGLDLETGLIAQGIAALRRQRIEDEQTRERIRREAEQRRANAPRGDNASLIEDFNAENSVATMLEICGYEQSPRNAEDWRSPHQTGETYATRVIGSKWVSLSASDAESGLGQKCSAGCYGDAYDLFVHYKHGGDHKAAYRQIGAEKRAAQGNVTYPPQFHAEPPEWLSAAPLPDEAPEWAECEEHREIDEEAFAAAAGVDYGDRWPEPVNLWQRFEEPELPQGLLPLTVEVFARKQAAIMGADAAGMAMAVMTVCATAIPDSVELQVKRNDPTWREHARLWTALVGPPSRKKTPVFKAAMGPLRAIDNQLMRAYLQACEEWEALDKDEKKATPKPKQRRLIISDTTIEAAQEVMMDSPDGILSEQDELSGWFGSMDRYNTKGGGDRAFWLKAFNGGTYNLNRIGRGAKQISNLSISLLGGIQPEPMRKFASESVDDGLLQRMIPVILRPSTVGQDIAQDQSATEYEHLVSDLYGLRKQGHKLIHFSDGARAVRDQLEREHLELSMALETVSPKLAAHYGKYDGIFARLCLIWHCIECAYRDLPSEISEDTARRVAAFMHEFIRPSAIAFYAGILGMSAGHEELVALASIVIAKGLTEVGARDAQSAGQTLRHITADQFRQLAEKMEAFGWLERGEPKPKSNTPRWLVNPKVHDLFAERAAQEMSRREAARNALRNALMGDQ
ncbi:DUF3987 domain-containing protein [Novosphingobium sp. NPDC080210]|uniref:DUF3987 domain-containing protein n=1 Tax=Novosphingobium sp. NPDC080210 TaxID=3390596 RepID=UPI003D05B81B